MDESCSIQAPSSSCIKKNETTEVVSQKSNFEGSPQFWLIMIGFIVMGGSCSLAGTWWDRKNKKDKKEEKKQ